MTQLATVGRQTAAHLPALQDTREHGQYLIFSLAGEAFAIDILHVKEIIECWVAH